MDKVIKRLNYFDHQFLRADDFNDEQAYHVEMRRAHNKLLHTWGIADGLGLSFVSGASRVVIGQGVAVDGEGREIVLSDDAQTGDLRGHGGKTVFITIAYSEKPSDPAKEVVGDTRWTEAPLIDVSENPPDDPSQTLILGRATLDADGKVVSTDEGLDLNARRTAGVVGGHVQARSVSLTDPNVVSAQWPRLVSGAPGRADLAGSLQVTGDVTIAGKLTGGLGPNTVGAEQIADDAVSAAKIQDGAVGATALADGAVTAPKLADNSVTFAKLSKRPPLVGETAMIDPGKTSTYYAFTFPVARPLGLMVVVHAYSPTRGATFNWTVESATTDPDADQQPEVQQKVVFHNLGTKPIQIRFKIYLIVDAF